MDFRKITDGGRGGHIRSKKNHYNFFTLETAVLVMNFRENFKKKGGNFRSEKFHCKFVPNFWKNCNIFSEKAVCKFSEHSSILGSATFPKWDCQWETLSSWKKPLNSVKNSKSTLFALKISTQIANLIFCQICIKKNMWFVCASRTSSRTRLCTSAWPLDPSVRRARYT